MGKLQDGALAGGRHRLLEQGLGLQAARIGQLAGPGPGRVERVVERLIGDIVGIGGDDGRVCWLRHGLCSAIGCVTYS